MSVASSQVQLGLSLIIYGSPKSGKALALTTPIPTPSGWTTIGDLHPGDEIFNAEGAITHVVALGPIWDNRPCREVSVKGDAIIADAAHVWRATRPKGDNLGTYALVETDDLRTPGGTGRCLPWTPCLQLPDVSLLVHPYILGAWLGDGSVRDCTIAGVDGRKLEVLQRCRDLWGSGQIWRDAGSNLYGLQLPGLRTALDEAGARVCKDRENRVYLKSVPSVYLRSGTEQRRELLAGLFDTDGCFTAYRAQCGFCNTSVEIAEAFAELACSLGIRAHLSGPSESWAIFPDGSRHRGKDSYGVGLRGVVASHRITHRSEWASAMPETRHRQYYRVHVNDVREVPSVPVRCIQVDDIHGMFLAGKTMIPTHNSWLGDTTPAPRLVLDAEGGSRFTPSRKVNWDPARESPPAYDGSWESCLVPVTGYKSVKQAYDWLYSGQHPFRSVVIDSISETQQRGVDDIAGTNQMQVQDWGVLLRTVSDLVRRYRDLLLHPVKPLQAVLLIAMMDERAHPKRPYMQGQIATTLPYYTDIVGHLGVYLREDGTTFRRLIISNHPDYVAGERVGGRLGPYVDDPDITSMIKKVTGWVAPEPASAQAAKG